MIEKYMTEEGIEINITTGENTSEIITEALLKSYERNAHEILGDDESKNESK